MLFRAVNLAQPSGTPNLQLGGAAVALLDPDSVEWLRICERDVVSALESGEPFHRPSKRKLGVGHLALLLVERQVGPASILASLLELPSLSLGPVPGSSRGQCGLVEGGLGQRRLPSARRKLLGRINHLSVVPGTEPAVGPSLGLVLRSDDSHTRLSPPPQNLGLVTVIPAER